MNFEGNRLDTFNDWPIAPVISPHKIAKAGFFYTKERFKVECFCCHLQIDEWQYGDQVMAKHRNLRPDCPFVIDPLMADNIPLVEPSQSSSSCAQNPYSTEEQRLATFTDWPKSTILTPDRLAKSGFYFLKREDRTKCAFCKGVVMNWEQGDDPDLEHKRHFPNCSFVLNTITPRLVRTSDFEPNDELGINRHQGPKHPQFGTVESRLSSFQSWRPELLQTPEMLAEAGFFYEGFGDMVRCFHCDGGLRHWDPADDPWTEHARWFGTCAFVRLIKGIDFVNSCSVGRNVRDLPRREDTTAMRRTISDHEVQEHLSKEPALKALSIGLCLERVKRAIREKLEKSGRSFMNPDALVEAALTLQHEEELEETISETDDPFATELRERTELGIRPHVVESSVDTVTEKKIDLEPKPEPTTLEEENRLLKEARLCKICMDVEVGIVFLPCGHLASCVTCAANLELCPVCRSAIKATVRTFLS